MSTPRQTILLVEDDAALRDALATTLDLAGYAVAACADGPAALAALARGGISAIVTDYQMKPMDGLALLTEVRAVHPHLPVLMITAHGSIEHAVRSMLAGASDYLAKPFPAPRLIEHLRRLAPPVVTPAGNMVAADPAMLEMLELAGRVARTDATVLVSGESGVGKEVIARFIHQHSARLRGPFVAINCAAIPENMLEALLFGHEKGAFTGAHESRPGKFEQAQSGTLLLDEVSEMDLALQAKLLRVLQEREVERIGGRSPVALDVRVIATTNRDLRAEVVAGRFREDLYYRLSVFPLAMPALRARPRDILPLANYFLASSAGNRGAAPSLADDAVAALLAHDWPGNVRELQNLLQRALIMVRGNVIHASDLRFEPRRAQPAPAAAPTPAATPVAAGLQDSLQSVEGDLIADAIRRAGSREGAAALLGISPRTLRYRIARLRDAGIPIPAGREPAGPGHHATAAA
jgi:two-component system response regulator FlrC